MHSLLKNIESIPVFSDLTRIYSFLGLPFDMIDAGSQFAIHHLKTDPADTSYRSSVSDPAFIRLYLVRRYPFSTLPSILSPPAIANHLHGKIFGKPIW